LGYRKITGRHLKKEIHNLLEKKDIEQLEIEICRYPVRQVVNPLFLFLCSTDEKIKWPAVVAMGTAVSRLAEQDMESARVVMRRFMWNLNEESGGIGWGCPEAMGEAMARSGGLAEEYCRIVISYLQPGGNFLEHEVLQQGVLWAMGRLAHARPELLQSATPLLRPFMQSGDTTLRGLAVWAAGPLAPKTLVPILEKLQNDFSELEIFRQGRLRQFRIKDLAAEALDSIQDRQEIVNRYEMDP
jgi:hypothetical protein